MTEEPAHKSILEGERFDAVSAVVGQVAHDFNNLLTPLLAYPPLIRSDLPEGAHGADLLGVMEKTARDMVHITRQLLELATRRNFEKRSLDINKLVKKTIQGVRNSVPIPDGVTIETVLGQDLAPLMGTDERLVVALGNVCVNGIESMKSGGILRVETRTLHEESRMTRCGCALDSGDYLKVSVTDSGSGVPEDLLDKVFEPFVSTKKAAGRRGAGLGLSVVYRIMRDHGGCIDFGPAPGGGCTFALYFPLGEHGESGGDQGAIATTSMAPTPAARTACNPERVMVVDDEKTILRLFQTILSSGLPDRKIDVAGNGQEALELFSTGHHAVLVMDLCMPVMDGHAAFLAIERLCRERNWRMPSIVFCTGFAPPDTVKSIVSANPAHELLAKPVRGDLLVKAVRDRLAP